MLLVWKWASLVPRRARSRDIPGFCRVAAWIALVAGTSLAGAQTPSPVNSATTLTITRNSQSVSTIAAGSAVTLTATVTAGSTPVTPGLVRFCDATAKYCEDTHLLGSAQLTSAGTASIVLRPSIGSHSYAAQFVGTHSYAASASGAASLAVSGTYPSSATLTVTGNSGAYNLAAAVTGAGLWTAAPSGTVSFLDTSNSNAVLASASLSLGTPSLALTESYSLPASSDAVLETVAVADLNHDGIPDLVAVYAPDDSELSDYLIVLLGNGDGTFTQTGANTSICGGSQMVSADFNDDGIPDLAVVCGNTGVSILLGNGDGTFTPGSSVSLSVPAQMDIVVGDFNGDGIADLAILEVLSDDSVGTVTVYFGQGDGTFVAGPTNSVAVDVPRGMVTGDFNGDGKLDLGIVNAFSGPNAPSGINTTTGTVSVLLGKGDGTFTQTSGNPPAGTNASSIAVADFNGDGIPDIASGSSDGIFLLTGKGDGTFSSTNPATVSPAYLVGNFVANDFNGDGVADLAVIDASASPNVIVFLGDGSGDFTQAGSYSFQDSDGANGIAAANLTGNLNGTGQAGLVVTRGLTAAILLTQPQYSATASVSTNLAIGSGVHQLEVNYAGDSNYGASASSATAVDAVVADSLTLTVPAGPYNAGQSATFTATLSPYSGSGYNTNGETVSFYNNGTLLGTGTLLNGVATYTINDLVSQEVAGEYNVIAKYSGDAGFAAANSYEVGVDATPVATSVHLSVNPAAPTPGQTLTFTATLSPYVQGTANTNGEYISIYRGGGNNIPGTYIGSGVLSNGVATFTWTTPITAGPWYWSAVYGGDNLFGSSIATVIQQVIQPTSLALTTNLNPSNYGGSVTLTASLIQDASPGLDSDGGVVTFMNGSTVLGTAIMNGTGVAQLVTSALPAGTDSLVAVFAAYNDLAAATSSPFAQTVQPIPLTITAPKITRVYGSTNPSLAGTYKGATSSDSFTVTGTTIATHASAVGSYVIVPVANGPNLADYTVIPVNGTVTVTQATPIITLASSSSATAPSAPVTFTATLKFSVGSPTGSVSFFDGSTLLATEAVSSGIASYTDSGFTAGLHSVTAVYSGDANFVPVTSAAVSETIEAISLALTSSGSTSATASAGGQAVYALSCIPPAGQTFPQPVTLSVSGLPAGASASFSTNPIPVGAGATNVTLTVSVASSASLQTGQNPFGSGTWPAALALLLLPFSSRLGRRAQRLFCVGLLSVIGFTLALSACGGSGGVATNSAKQTTPPQSYTLTVTAISGSTSNSFPLTLNLD